MKSIFFLLSLYFFPTFAAPPSYLKNIEPELQGRDIEISEKAQTSSKIEKVKDYFFGPDWDFSFNYPEINLGDNAGLNLGYNYKTSYDGHTFIRTDTIKMGININPGDLFNGLPIYIKVSDHANLSYKRRFSSKKEAKEAGAILKPYFPSKANVAIKNMRPGDIFSFPTTLNIALGSSLNQIFPPTPFMAGLKGEFFITGQFIVHIIALTENRFRLKIESISDKGISAGGYIVQNYVLTNVKIIDGVIKDVLYFDLASVGLSYKKRHQFLIDYVFNFNVPKARQAYNQIMNTALAFKVKRHFNPFKGKVKSNKYIISSLKNADKMALEDKNKPIEKKRIIRVFKGSIDSHTTSMFLRLSAFIASSTLTSIYSRQTITSLDENNNRQKYFFPTYMSIKRSGLILGKLSKFKFFLLSSLYKLDKQNNISDFNSFGTLYFNRDFSYSKKDLSKFQNHLKLNIPENIYQSISWPSYLKSLERKNRDPLKNSLAMFQILLSKDIFEILEGIDYTTLRYQYKKYSKGLKKRGLLKSPKFSKVFLQNRISIRRMLKRLETIFNARQNNFDFTPDVKTHIKKFMGLRSSPLFKNLGVGFMLYLLKDKELKSLVNIFILLNSEGEKGFSHLFGDSSKHHLFKAMRAVQLSPSIQPYNYKRISYPK